MKITFLGTGAADTPMMLPQQYQHSFSTEIRRNSCALVQDWLLIDCGPHALDSLELLHADLFKITDLCVTHTHGDHIAPVAVAKLAAGRKAPFRIWCDAGAVPVFSEIPNADIHPLRAGQAVSIADCSVIPLSANHLVENSAEQPLHYLLEYQGKRMFYGCDGAWLRADSFLILQQDRPLDLMVFDATVGREDEGIRLGSHNSLAMLQLLLPLLHRCGIANEQTKAVLSHMAISLHQPYDCIVKEMEPKGFTVAYDGLEISF